MTIDAPTREQLPALKSLWQEAFGDGEDFVALFFRTGFAFDRCRVAMDGGRVLGALYWFDCACGSRNLAYLYAVGVFKAFRGRGVGRRLMEETHGYLEALGYDGTVLCPADEALFGYYAAMGYETCAWVDTLQCAAGSPVALRPVTPTEYGVLRRGLLPRQSVVQEGVTLEYMAGFLQLYAGDGFVLAAYRKDGCLYGELLGDVSAAPGIVAALGCQRGSFRTPGTQTPFAMYRGKGAMPSYLGLDLG